MEAKVEGSASLCCFFSVVFISLSVILWLMDTISLMLWDTLFVEPWAESQELLVLMFLRFLKFPCNKH